MRAEAAGLTMFPLPLASPPRQQPEAGPATYPNDRAFGTIGATSGLATVETAGGMVAQVREDGPAARAGLLPGDRLIAVDGAVPRDQTDVRYQVEGQDEVTLDV